MNLASARRSGKTRQIFHLKLGVLFIPILFSSSPKFAESPAWEIRQKGYLPAIYAHLISLSQIERLASMKKPASSLSAEDAPASTAARRKTKEVLQ